MRERFVWQHFWGLSASILGTYEAVSFLTRFCPRTLPTISTWCSRKRRRQLLMMGWTAGLALHIGRHRPT